MSSVIFVTPYPERVVKRAFYLAYKACGGTTGLGFLQAKPDVTEEDVWNHLHPAPETWGENAGLTHAYGDYVYGRMMKLGFWWSDTEVRAEDGIPRPDYQGWSRTYPTYLDLLKAAEKSLEDEGESR